jgi:hypothetical protein
MMDGMCGRRAEGGDRLTQKFSAWETGVEGDTAT